MSCEALERPDPAEPATFFAPPGRASPADLADDLQEITESPWVDALLATVGGLMFVLNPQRQILAANQAALDLLGAADLAAVVGKRPGEALGCVRSGRGPNGCGTSPGCATCGATLAILACRAQREPVEDECLLTRDVDGELVSCEYRVRAAPVGGDGQGYTVFVLNDISGEKRRDALEHAFLHDLANTIGGLTGWGALLKSGRSEVSAEAAERIVGLSARLRREVESFVQLLQAESGALGVHPRPIALTELLSELEEVFAEHAAATGKRLVLPVGVAEETIASDPALLARVLINMVKNAFEAIAVGEAVTVGFERGVDGVTFTVHNPGVIPERVAHQIFQRTFSTKAPRGRGLGTYSMKLLGERYLGGRVGFQTSPEAGTVFAIRLPNGGAAEPGSA